jgi:hypothetical protein
MKSAITSCFFKKIAFECMIIGNPISSNVAIAMHIQYVISQQRLSKLDY